MIRCLPIILLASLVLSACKAAPAAPAAIPTTRSPLVGPLIWQQDGDCGYAMLRPVTWKSTGAAPLQGRSYYPEAQSGQTRLLLTVTNYRAWDGHTPADGVDVHWQLFQASPSLDAWIKAVLQTLWKEDLVRLERSLDRARIYSIRSRADHVRLVGYVVDQQSPLVVMLEVGGETAASLDAVQEAGLLDDFAAIVESARAIAINAGQTSPALSEP